MAAEIVCTAVDLYVAGRQFLMPGQISSSVDVQEKMLEILRQEGAVPVYKLAKLLGLTYGGVQWHIGRLERRGLVYTVRVGGRRYVVLKGVDNGVDLLAKVAVEDVVKELVQALSVHGVELKTPLREALERLEAKAPHLAEALRLIAERESH
jgi:DNA-binding transcriptional ArsR family regulator